MPIAIYRQESSEKSGCGYRGDDSASRQPRPGFEIQILKIQSVVLPSHQLRHDMWQQSTWGTSRRVASKRIDFSENTTCPNSRLHPDNKNDVRAAIDQTNTLSIPGHASPEMLGGLC
ncbi:hypothetical protein TIFTF001_020136 [Ficus carica]|uniref:Uncharacterized protein n=1 Tax=Ficus carica TaxID=3494 RepID=A0AA88AEU7_FICCA|nr:hypothetical protein TIFTF001_020136 [Ficus carica]